MNSQDLEKKLYPLFENTGFDIADLRLSRNSGKMFIQIFIDKENGDVNLKDCEEWTDKIGSFIDMNSIIDGGYVIELSSPGVDRVIKKEKDFLRFRGQDVKITLKVAVDGTRVYYSKITGFENGKVFFEDDLSFELEKIQEVRLNPNYDELLKK